MPNYGYFLPIAENLFTSVKFLDLSPKTELKFGVPEVKLTKEGVPQYVLTALVKFGDEKPQTEAFTIALEDKQVNSYRSIPELSQIRLLGLRGGKWSRQDTDKTSWSFQISAIEVLK
jgi:hypothetical protein